MSKAQMTNMRQGARLISNVLEMVAFNPPGGTHRLHGRRDARRYGSVG